MDRRDIPLENRIDHLKFIKQCKKDIYQHFPSIKLQREIIELISYIKYLEGKAAASYNNTNDITNIPMA